MGSYTPGLKVTPGALLYFDRRLPLLGEVLVQEGERVEFDREVARTELPGRVEMVNLANKLGLDPAEVPKRLKVALGQRVTRGQTLAYSKGFFGYFRAPFECPIEGAVESVSAITGQVILRSPPRPISLNAYVDGVVEAVEVGQGVRIRTFGTLIQGIFGLGGETSGPLEIKVERPEARLAANDLHPDDRGKTLVVGSLASSDLVRRAAELGVSALIAGGIDDSDVRDLLGYDLGVAITGGEKLGVTVVVTEGFGPLPMADRTFGLLKDRAGCRASVSGATQIRAGVIRPEIIVTRLDGDWDRDAVEPPDLELAVGVPVRLIREPNFGSLARVVELPVKPCIIPSGACVRVAEVELEDGSRMRLPRANLELIEGAPVEQ